MKTLRVGFAQLGLGLTEFFSFFFPCFSSFPRHPPRQSKRLVIYIYIYVSCYSISQVDDPLVSDIFALTYDAQHLLRWMLSHQQYVSHVYTRCPRRATDTVWCDWCSDRILNASPLLPRVRSRRVSSGANSRCRKVVEKSVLAASAGLFRREKDTHHQSPIRYSDCLLFIYM